MANDNSSRVPNSGSKPPLVALPVPGSKQALEELSPSTANHDKSIVPVRGTILLHVH